MPTCNIVPVDVSRVDELVEIGRKTFMSTFASDNNPKDMSAYLERAFAREKLAAEIQRPGSDFFFAQVANRVAGYLKINTEEAQTEHSGLHELEIERIYVDDAWQGAGVGKALFDFAVEQARGRTCDSVWLGVWERNERAIAFYKRQGFQEFGTHDFVLGADVQTDLLMRLSLK